MLLICRPAVSGNARVPGHSAAPILRYSQISAKPPLNRWTAPEHVRVSAHAVNPEPHHLQRVIRGKWVIGHRLSGVKGKLRFESHETSILAVERRASHRK